MYLFDQDEAARSAGGGGELSRESERRWASEEGGRRRVGVGVRVQAAVRVRVVNRLVRQLVLDGLHIHPELVLLVVGRDAPNKGHIRAHEGVDHLG